MAEAATPGAAATESPLKLEASWRERVGEYLRRPDMRALAAFLRSEKAAGKRIHPDGSQIFAALEATPFDQVKVVILGQDPYHGPGQAHGLCFSVPAGVDVPPSLLNIFKELERDLGIARPAHGNLQAWARQGVLLLNAVLTGEGGRAGANDLVQKPIEERLLVTKLLFQLRVGRLMRERASPPRARGAA